MTAPEATRGRRDAIGPRSGRPHFGGFEALRALAATMVVVHHAGSVAGGAAAVPRTGRIETWASVFDGGVAVFFVMSGFLLWRPMSRAALAGTATQRLAAFWWRRILRIVPAYWIALTALWAVGAFDLGGDWWRYYLFLQIYSSETIMGGIVVAWSLCTEMAFYLVLPILGAAVARVGTPFGPRGRTAVQATLCTVLWLGGFLSRHLVDPHPAIRGLAFSWLPQNLDLFAAGMALATLSAVAAGSDRLRSRLDGISTPVWPWWSAAVALFAWYALRVGPTSFEVGYTGWYWHQRQLVLGAFTVLLLVPVVFGDQATGLLRRAWGFRPIVWVGLVSYGLYLWHLDLMGLAMREDLFGLATTAARGATSDPATVVLVAFAMAAGLVAAALSWYCLERPLARLRDLVGDSRGSRTTDTRPPS